jgi:hypothetical protein
MNASAPPTGSTDRERPPEALLAFVLVAAVLALKAPDAITLPQFWAEDGNTLFIQQYDTAAPRLFTSVAGYLVTLQRLVAWMATPLSNVHAPLVYCSAALLFGALSLWSLRRLPLPGAAFWALVGAVALTPTSGETFGSLINVQWLVQFYLFVPVARFLTGERSRWPLASASITAVAALTGPFSIFAMAGAVVGYVALWIEARLARDVQPLRTLPRPGAEIIVLAAGAVVQTCYLKFGSFLQPTSLVPSWTALADVVAALQSHTLGAMRMPSAAFCLIVVGAAVLAWLGAGTPARRAVLVAITVAAAAQLWAFACKYSAQPYPIHALGTSDRYFTIFKICFWVAIVLALGTLFVRRRHLALPVTIALLAAVAIANPPEHLRRAALVDFEWSKHAERMDRGEAVATPVNPPNWVLNVPAATP